MKIKEINIEIRTGAELKKIAIPFFLLLAVPFLGLSSTLSAAAIFGAFLCCYNLMLNRYYVDRYMAVVLLLFAAGEAMALSSCHDLSRTVTFSIQKLIVILVLYPTMMIYLDSLGALRKGMDAYKYGCLFVAVLALISYVFRVSLPFVSTKFLTGRLVVSDMGPNVVARLFCVGAFIALYEAQIQTGRERIIAYAEYAVIVLAVLATISTSGLALLMIGTAMIYVSYNNGVHKEGVIKVCAVALAAVILLFVLYNTVPYIRTQVDKLLTREAANKMLDADNTGFSLHGRMEGLKNYRENAVSHFFIGVGYGCSSILNGKTIHFPILAALVETGIFGFFSCLILYMYPAYASVRLWRNKSYRIFGIISLVIIIGDMVQPNPNYVFTWFGIFLSACALRCSRGVGLLQTVRELLVTLRLAPGDDGKDSPEPSDG